MQKIRLVIFLMLLCLLLSQVAAIASEEEHYNVDTDYLALAGYDPVSYFDMDPVKGNMELSHSYKGINYRFVSSDNRDRFMAAPEKFIPAYGGWCAWAMLEGEKVKVNPLRYKVVDGVNYLFYDGFWGNTLEKWNEKAANDTEHHLVETAAKQWQKIVAR